MITQRIEIQVCRTPGGAFVYDVVDLETKQLWLKGAKEPLTETARLLAWLGASDEDRVEMYRPGHHGWDMRGSIGFLRRKTAKEDDKTSVRWANYVPERSSN
jgi:hypothetical protein